MNALIMKNIHPIKFKTIKTQNYYRKQREAILNDPHRKELFKKII